MEQALGYSPIGYENLAVAIVAQAAKDLRLYPKEVETFFLSPRSIFAMCMPNYDGEAILNQIKRNYATNGTYYAVDSDMEGDNG